MSPDRTARGLAAAAAILALVALGFSALDSGPDGRVVGSLPDPGGASPDTATAAAILRLEERLAALERVASQPVMESADPGGTTPARTSLDGAALAALEARLQKLEVARDAAAKQTQRLADPDAIPAALAVLLATRGVLIKIGDIAAIQAHYATLAEIVSDESVPVWGRLEAYRGLLMFGGGETLAKETLPALASIVATSLDAKARRGAAVAMANAMHPGVAGALIAPYHRERDAAVREAIVRRFVQCASDPVVRQTLAAVRKNDTSPSIRALAARALAESK